MPVKRSSIYVITGAPSSGKTTLIASLEQRGFRVFYEAAREYIDKKVAEGKELTEIRGDELDFQRKVLELKVMRERQLPDDTTIFLDRGIPDSVAYFTLCGSANDPVLAEATAGCAYKKIFLLDMLPYGHDYARTETEAERNKLHELLSESYVDLGFPVTPVPVLPVEARADFIINQL